MSKVVILKVDKYDKTILAERIKKALADNFDINSLFNPQDKILIKPNLLMATDPDDAVTTHPLVVSAVMSIFKEKGHDLFVGESPGEETLQAQFCEPLLGAREELPAKPEPLIGGVDVELEDLATDRQAP